MSVELTTRPGKGAAEGGAARRPPALRACPGTRSQATACVSGVLRTGDLLLERVSATLRRYGLTLSMANALTILEGTDGPLPPHAISERLLVSRGAVTQIIDALEKRGLVRRIAHPRDRRSLLVEMTAEGRSLRREVEPVLTRRDEVWMGGLCAEERDAFLRLLEKTQAHLERTPECDG